MSGPLSKVPEGFLSFLNLKSQGRNPDIIESNLRPGLDMFAFYASEETENYIANRSGVSVNSGVIETVEVPSGEIWIPLRMGMVQNIQNGGEAANMALIQQGMSRTDVAGSNGTPGNFAVPLASTKYTKVDLGAFVVSDQIYLHHQWAQKTLYFSGTQFRFRTAGGSMIIGNNFQFWLEFIRLNA